MNEIVSNEYSDSHKALDIVSADHDQTDIIALESGIVESAVKNIKTTDHTSKGLATYGNYVKINQTNGKSALYAHMKYGSVNVNVGDFVEKGAIIGTMGNTGNAYGTHLHLEIKNENNYKENPIISLNEKSQKQKENIIEKNTNKEDIQTNENIANETPNNHLDYKTNKDEENNTNSNENEQFKNTQYLNNYQYKDGSIVDGLKEIDIDSSYSYRERLAEKNGITNYTGSYSQNVRLLKLLKEGKLIKA